MKKKQKSMTKLGLQLSAGLYAVGVWLNLAIFINTENVYYLFIGTSFIGLLVVLNAALMGALHHNLWFRYLFISLVVISLGFPSFMILYFNTPMMIFLAKMVAGVGSVSIFFLFAKYFSIKTLIDMGWKIKD